MKEYLKMCSNILQHGEKRLDRTNTGTISLFGVQSRYDLTKGFPLVTTKKMFTKSIIEELLWFLKGDTNIKYLVDKNVGIWNEWAYENYKNSNDFKGENIKEFIEKIKELSKENEFVKRYGELGPIYGKQWRDFNGSGVDQIQDLIKNLKENPFSRRHILCAWNPSQINQMALPPCHSFVQFYVSNDKQYLSCQLYQRSGDVFLGVPFNIASYSLLTYMLSQICGYKPKEFIHTIGDAHIYNDHIDNIKEQLKREPYPLCQLQLNPFVEKIEEFTIDDIEIKNYKHHPVLKGKVSV